MKLNRPLSIGAIAAVLSLLLTACSLALGRSVEPPVVTELVIDVSESMAPSVVQKRLLADVQRVVEATATRGGLLLGDLVTSNPTNDSDTPIFQNFKPSDDIKGNDQYEVPERQQRVDSVMDQVRSMLASVQRGRTDLLTSCIVAHRVLSRHNNVTRRELVFFSDMIQNAGGYNFYDADLSDRQIMKMLDTLKRSRALPDLSGVHVYVSGAGIDPSHKVTASRNLAIGRFWSAYFEAANAEMDPGDYSARLPVFP